MVFQNSGTIFFAKVSTIFPQNPRNREIFHEHFPQKSLKVE